MERALRKGEWRLACVGVVEQIERQDIDKSKTNPNFKLTLHVRPSEVTADKEDVELPDLLRFGVLENDLYGMGAGDIQEGARVSLEGHATGIRPALVTLTKISVVISH